MYIKCFEEFTKNEMVYLINKNKTNVKKDNHYFKIFSNIEKEIIDYDFNKFDIGVKEGDWLGNKNIGSTLDIIITPDQYFNEMIYKIINKYIWFNMSIKVFNFNCVELDFVLDEKLRGLNIGYKIYKLVINKLNYISSRNNVTKFSKNIWYKLLQDPEYYSITTKNNFSCVIRKNITNSELKIIINNIRDDIKKQYDINFNDLIFDKKLKIRLCQLMK